MGYYNVFILFLVFFKLFDYGNCLVMREMVLPVCTRSHYYLGVG